MAQICYHGFLETADKTANGYDIVNDCTYAKKEGTQTVLGGNNRHVEALKQDNPHHQPLYKKNVLNGHGSAQLRARAALCFTCPVPCALFCFGRARRAGFPHRTLPKHPHHTLHKHTET